MLRKKIQKRRNLQQNWTICWWFWSGKRITQKHFSGRISCCSTETHKGLINASEQRSCIIIYQLSMSSWHEWMLVTNTSKLWTKSAQNVHLNAVVFCSCSCVRLLQLPPTIQKPACLESELVCVLFVFVWLTGDLINAHPASQLMMRFRWTCMTLKRMSLVEKMREYPDSWGLALKCHPLLPSLCSWGPAKWFLLMSRKTILTISFAH